MKEIHFIVQCMCQYIYKKSFVIVVANYPILQRIFRRQNDVALSRNDSLATLGSVTVILVNLLYTLIIIWFSNVAGKMKFSD